MIDRGWIETAPLQDVATWVRGELKHDKTWRDGTTLGLLVKRLIAAEVVPGGPYRNETGSVDRTLNTTVAQIFEILGITVPALAPYLPAHKRSSSPRIHEPGESSPAERQASSLVTRYPMVLRRGARRLLKPILTIDHSGEISRISELFGTSLSVTPPCDYASLGAANVLTWIAYSAYDDFIDGDGEPWTLPIANITHRDALVLYRSSSPAHCHSMVQDAFQAMDEANAWELRYCRFVVDADRITIGSLPRYGNLQMLAHRAGAHILGPLLVARLAGLLDEHATLIRRSLNDYLIARQLNDDLHDWVDDYAAGHISPVVAYLLRQAGLPQGDQSISATTAVMRRIFWQSGLSDMSTTALRYSLRAERTLARSGMRNDVPFIRDILTPIRRSLQQGLARHAADKAFYKAYHSSV